MNSHKEDLAHIRSIMEKSSTFISLSGWSGVGAGLVALAGSIFCWWLIQREGIDYFEGQRSLYGSALMKNLLILAIITLLTALLVAYYFTYKKAQKLGHELWNSLTRSLLIQLLVPLIAGGLFCLFLIQYSLFFMIAPSTLLFYGLSLISASRILQNELFWLGILEILLGLLGLAFPGFGLLLWAFGFGILHILYGFIMQHKYH